MNARKLSAGLVASGVVTLASSCSQVDTLCDLICDCEHCSELSESARCEAIALDQELADIYDCASAWETWAECVENKGQCREDDATFTTAELDFCASFIDLQVACAGDADCNQPDAFCNNGSCMRRSCNENPQQPCSSDSDCPSGPDQCEQERELLNDCTQANAGVVLGSSQGLGVAPGGGLD
ncbi:MAG: hypothetical protein JRI23_24260 [Deltaproteobacteria bacterium]|jgi:hypothetical protein|nr:hypothetical protein [Deltaproteobacteria bacterium]MBW2535112.1 hypothetical protein [Deltaproteobacteria bacterium]